VIARRIAAFAAVGAGGFLVQVVVFTASTTAGWPYLAATAVAVEAAVLHNFVWYERWTWADRAARGSAVRRLAWFNASVGATSIAGNVAIVAALVRVGGMSPLAANVLAVGLLGAVNFAIADWWVFAASAASATPRRQDARARRPSRTRF
jgi:putative flippase GtrA